MKSIFLLLIATILSADIHKWDVFDFLKGESVVYVVTVSGDVIAVSETTRDEIIIYQMDHNTTINQ